MVGWLDPITKMVKNAKKAKPVKAQAKRNAVVDVVDTVTRALPKGTFRTAGAALGSPFGPMGSLVGGMLGSGLATITGRGDYTVTTNSLAKEGGALTSLIPSFNTSGNTRNVRVSHRECFGTVVAPATPANFNNLDYVINPSNASMFPWLSALARNYEKYRLHGAVIYYESSSSDYASNTAMGTVILATNYNSAERPWVDDISMLNAEFSVGSKPSVNQAHPLECKAELGASGFLYVRDLAANQTGLTVDPRLYDVGRFQVATKGLTAPAGTELGRLWITYDIELVRPLMSPSGSMLNGAGTVIGSDLTTVGAGATGQTVTAVGTPFWERQATTTPVITPSSILISVQSATGNYFDCYLCRDGVYTFNYQVDGSAFSGTGTTSFSPVGGVTGTLLSQYELVSGTKAVGTVTYSINGANGRTNAYCILQIRSSLIGTITGARMSITYVDGTGSVRYNLQS